MNCRNLILLLLLLTVRLVFAANDYITLTADDESGANKYSYFYAGKWSDTRAPHADADYLVPNGLTLLLPQNYAVREALGLGDIFVFGGHSLTIADGGILRCETVSTYWDGYRGYIGDLRMEGGSTFYNTGCGDPLHHYWLTGGTMSILSTSAAKPVSILSTNSGDPKGGNLIRIQTKIVGGEKAYLKLGSRWGGDNPGALEFDSDFSDYCGTIEITDSKIAITNLNTSLEKALLKVQNSARSKLVMDISTILQPHTKLFTLEGKFDKLIDNIEVISTCFDFEVICVPANGKTEVLVNLLDTMHEIRSEDDQYRFFWTANYKVCHEDFKAYGFNTVINPAPNSEVNNSFLQSIADWNSAGFDHITRFTFEGLAANKSKYPRIKKDGTIVEDVIDAANADFVAETRESAAKLAALLAMRRGNVGVQTCTEIRDSSCPSFTPAMSNAYFAATGKVVPPEADGRSAPKWSSLAGFPTNRVVETTHPVLSFYRWFWQHGDGWNDYQTLVADEFRRAYAEVGRAEPLSMYDPSQREPALWGAGGNVSHLNHWSYLYKRPFNISFLISEQQEMARGRPGQKVLTMIQGISYRDGLTYTNQVPANAPWWVAERPNARLITTPPDMLREGLWCVFSRKLDGYGFHGWNALWDGVAAGVDRADTTGYTCTNNETRRVIDELQNAVGVPLGPLLKKMDERPAEIAVLESYASQIFSGGTPFAWAVRDSAMGYFSVAADLAPEVLYEEDIAIRGIPDHVKVLVMHDCAVLTREAYEKIAAFQSRGGKILGDANLCPALTADAALPYIGTMSDGKEDDEFFQSSLKTFKSVVGKYIEPYVASIGNHLISHSRLAGSAADAVFVVNDKREAGNYVGQWGRVLEKGVANSGLIRVKRRAAVVYDLVTHKSVPSRLVGDSTIIDVAFTNTDGRVFLVCDRVLSPLKLATERSQPSMVTVTVTSPDTEVMIPIRIDGIGEEPVYGVVTNGVYARSFADKSIASGSVPTVFNLANDGETETQYVNDFAVDYEGKGCVVLAGMDVNTISNCSYHYSGVWSDGLAPHAGADYYVGYGMTLEAPMSAAILKDTNKEGKYNRFDGDSLTIGKDGRLHLNNTYTAYVDAYSVVIKDLRLLSGSLVDNESRGGVYPCRLGDGKMTILADASDPVRILSYGSVITNTMKLVGGEHSAIRLEGAKHVIKDDLADYHGLFILAPDCEVEFTNPTAKANARLRRDIFDATSGYVTLTANDVSSISNNSFHYKGKWSDGLSPHAGTNYYVGAGVKLIVPMSSAILVDVGKSGKNNRFDGDSLTIGDDGILHYDVCFTAYVDAYQSEITNLYLLGGATIENSNLDYPCRMGLGTMYVLSDERNPVRIVSNTGVITNTMNIVGDEFAVIRLSGNRHVIKGDLSKYKGRIIWDEGTKVEFANGCWDYEGILPGLPLDFKAANGYVTQTRGEDIPTTTTYGFSFDGSGNGVGSWSDGRATHSGTNYFTNCGMFLPETGGSFKGDVLVVGDGGYLRPRVNDKTFHFNDLRMLGGAHFWGLGTSKTTTLTGNLSIHSTTADPCFITGGDSNQTFEVAMKLRGNSESCIVLRPNINVANTPCRVDFTGDLTDYHGSIVASNLVTLVLGKTMSNTLVSFVAGCRLDFSAIVDTLKFEELPYRLFQVQKGFLPQHLPSIVNLPSKYQLVIEQDGNETYLSLGSALGSRLIFR